MSFYKGKRSASAPKKSQKPPENDWRGRSDTLSKDLGLLPIVNQPHVPYVISEMNVLVEPILSNGSVCITEVLIYHHNTVFNKHSRRIIHNGNVKFISLECRQDPAAKVVHKKVFGQKEFAFSWEFTPTCYQRIFKIKYVLENSLSHDLASCLDTLHLNDMKSSIQAPIRNFHVAIILPTRLFIFQKIILLNNVIPKDLLMDGMYIPPSNNPSKTGQTKLRKLEFGVQNAERYECISLDVKWIDSNTLKGLNKQTATQAINTLRLHSKGYKTNNPYLIDFPETVRIVPADRVAHEAEADDHLKGNPYDDENLREQCTTPIVGPIELHEEKKSPRSQSVTISAREGNRASRSSVGSSDRETSYRPFSASHQHAALTPDFE